MYQEYQITNDGQWQLVDSTLNLPSQGSTSSSQQGNASHVNYQQAPISASLHSDITFTQSVADIASQQSGTYSGNTPNFPMQFVHSSGQSVVSPPLMTSGYMQQGMLSRPTSTATYPWQFTHWQPNQVTLSKGQFARLHPRDQAAIKYYVENEKPPGLTLSAWTQYCRHLVVVSEHLRDKSNFAITDFSSNSDSELLSHVNYLSKNKFSGINREGNEHIVNTQLKDFLDWYNDKGKELVNAKLPAPAQTSQVSPTMQALPTGQPRGEESLAFLKTLSSYIENTLSSYIEFCSQPQTDNSQAVSTAASGDSSTDSNGSATANHASDDLLLKCILAARDEISNRTGISADAIQGVAFTAQVENGFPLFISDTTKTDNSLKEKDSFLRHAAPVFDDDGNGLAAFHDDGGTAYSATFKVNRDTGEVKELGILSEKLDAGGTHPDTMTIEQLVQSVSYRHNAELLGVIRIDTAQQPELDVSTAYVHHLAQPYEAPLFMTIDTVGKVNCDPEELENFFRYVQPQLKPDGSGSAQYVQNDEMRSVDFVFNPQTREITNFRLSKSMYIDLTDE